jgi:hypothetical protein
MLTTALPLVSARAAKTIPGSDLRPLFRLEPGADAHWLLAQGAYTDLTGTKTLTELGSALTGGPNHISITLNNTNNLQTPFADTGQSLTVLMVAKIPASATGTQHPLFGNYTGGGAGTGLILNASDQLIVNASISGSGTNSGGASVGPLPRDQYVFFGFTRDISGGRVVFHRGGIAPVSVARNFTGYTPGGNFCLVNTGWLRGNGDLAQFSELIIFERVVPSVEVAAIYARSVFRAAKRGITVQPFT